MAQLGFPLKNDFKPNDPLAKVPADWFKVVANILNDIQGIGCHIDKQGGGEGLGWQIVVDSEEAAGGAYPFQVVDNLDGTVRVYRGRWTRNGYTAILDTDTDEDYFTLIVGADEYVIVSLDADGNTEYPGVRPYKCVPSAVSSAVVADADNTILVLGKMTDSVWSQWHRGGDKDDSQIVFDSDSASANRYNSLQRDTTRVGADFGFAQLFGWANAASEASIGKDRLIPYQDNDANKTLKYISVEKLSAAGMLFEFRVDKTGSDSVSVTVGRATRNGQNIPVASASQSGISADTGVYLKLENASYPDVAAIAPATGTIVFGSYDITDPAIYLLANVSSNGSDITEILHSQVGAPDDYYYLTDTAFWALTSSETETPTETLEKVGSVEAWRLKGFHDPLLNLIAGSKPGSSDYIAINELDDGVSPNRRRLKYWTYDNLETTIRDVVVSYINAGDIIQHNALKVTTSTATEAYADVVNHDGRTLHYMAKRTTDLKAHGDFGQSKGDVQLVGEFYASELGVLASSTYGAAKATGNKWTAADFLVNASNSVVVQSPGKLSFTTTSNTNSDDILILGNGLNSMMTIGAHDVVFGSTGGGHVEFTAGTIDEIVTATMRAYSPSDSSLHALTDDATAGLAQGKLFDVAAFMASPVVRAAIDDRISTLVGG